MNKAPPHICNGKCLRSNCLAFALRKFFADRGYLIMRWSRHGWWFHFLWSKDLDHFEEFQPLAYTQGMKSPPFFFKGSIVKHDIHSDTDNAY